jgi:hypothetical protein
MSYGYLAALNNNAAAKTASILGKPYVPWNADEFLDERVWSRIPAIREAGLPTSGWKLLESRPTTKHIQFLIRNRPFPIGLVLVIGKSDRWINVYTPLDAAHEPRVAVK